MTGTRSIDTFTQSLWKLQPVRPSVCLGWVVGQHKLQTIQELCANNGRLLPSPPPS